jgi:UDP:flavonoid glycosyltransferase YjiC (YdhE family)
VRALAGLDVLVVAATAHPDGPAGVRRLLGTVPDNVRLATFVPFGLLLAAGVNLRTSTKPGRAAVVPPVNK